MFVENPSHQFEQSPLEGWDEIYELSERERMEQFTKIAYEVVAQVRADAPGRYLARERERLSRPLSPRAQARRERMKKLLRPIGAQ